MFSFTSNIIPNNIFVIGAGGTGSRLMPMLSQFMRSITRGKSATGWVENPTIWLVDDDVVELKNLLRQNFIAGDVGKPKAEVVAERYSRAHEVNIIPIVQRITSANADDFWGLISETIRNDADRNHAINQDQYFIGNLFASSIVIICVDSTEARRDILNTFIRGGGGSRRVPLNTFFIDAGNEDSFGQVSFFTPHAVMGTQYYDGLREVEKLPKLVPVTVPINSIPMDVDYYINLKDTESTASCADLNQTLAINALMATNIMGVVQNFYYRKPMTFNTLRTSLDGGNSTDYNTFNNFYRKAYKGTQQPYVTEKNGANKSLTFVRYLEQIAVTDHLYVPIKQAIKQQEIEAQRAAAEIRKAEQAAAKLIADKKRLEENVAKEKLERQAALKARLKAKKEAAEAAGEKPHEPLPAPVTSWGVPQSEVPQYAPQWPFPSDSNELVTAQAAVVTPATETTMLHTPELVAIPRVRRPRPVVELTVPEALPEVANTPRDMIVSLVDAAIGRANASTNNTDDIEEFIEALESEW